MIAKEVATRCMGGSFGGLLSYLTDDRGKTERVGEVRLSNCVSTDERRLGPFQASATAAGPVRMRYQKRPIHLGSAALYGRYIREREAADCRRSRTIARQLVRRQQEGERLEQRSHRRWAAVRLVARGRVGWMLWSAYARHVDRRDRERASSSDGQRREPLRPTFGDRAGSSGSETAPRMEIRKRLRPCACRTAALGGLVMRSILRATHRYARHQRQWTA